MQVSFWCTHWFADIDIYIILCSLIVREWCLKRTQSGPLVTPLSPHVHVCVAFFEKIIVPPCSIVFFVYASIFLVHPLICWNWHIYYFMRIDSERVVLEEHPIRAASHPPLLHPQVHVCLTLFEKFIVPPCSIVFFVHASIFLVHPLIWWHWHIYSFMWLDSEQVVLEEHPIGDAASETQSLTPRPTITYSHIISKNVILV